MTNAAIVVEGAEVAWVGRRSAIPKTPQGERSEVVPSPGQFVVPAMINGHCHLTLDGEPNFGAEVRQSDARATLKAFRDARAALRAGIATVAHGSGGMRVAAEAGIESIGHANLLDGRTVRVIKERDDAIVPTLLVVQSLLDDADALGPVIVERTRAVSARHREGVRMA